MKINNIIIAMSCNFLIYGSLFADPQTSAVWQDYQTSAKLEIEQLSAKDQIIKRSLILDEPSLKTQLKAGNTNKLSSRTINSVIQTNEINLPLPDGSFVRVKAIESPTLSPELSERYPEIRSWRVVAVDDSAITGRIDFTSNGFHAMLTLANGDSVFIDPDKKSSGNVYHSLSKRVNRSHFQGSFSCQVDAGHARHRDVLANSLDIGLLPKTSEKSLSNIPALDLKTYRLALAGTAEYTASQGGKSSAFASMVTTINRVNQVFNRDLGIHLQIVSGEQLLYTDATSDPYTNNDANALVDENRDNLAINFGVDNFDIGHVFAQGPVGGLAFVGVACLDSVNTQVGVLNALKAGGATGTTNPQGETFSIEFVAHEIGHQLGATHTFNSIKNGCGGGNRTAETAVEPGSGSSVMSYSGLCGSDDLQFNSEAMFHFASITQINSYTRNEEGSSCGSDTSTGNENPEVDAGLDINIPANTPFLLDGSATGGTSYSWDQTDTGTASPVDVDTGNNAIIRMTLPSTEEDRYIPRLSDLFSGSSTKGEKLPQTSRELNFTYVVRDGTGGVGIDSKRISVTDTRSTFTVVSQSVAETINIGQSIDVVWNKAGTDLAPVNCSNVDIQLIRENGVKNMLLAATDNDGLEQLNIPVATPVMTAARIMVVCSDNSFFNISAGDITIEQGSGDLTPPVITINGDNPVSIPQGSIYTDLGAIAVDNIDGNLTVAVLGTVNTAVVGSYTITYSAIDSSANTTTEIRTVNVTAIVSDTTPPVITLNGSGIIELNVGSSYVETGATAFDDKDGVVNITITGSVNVNTVGSYNIAYSAVDSAGNTATKVRTVNVITAAMDTIAPVINLNGDTTITLEVGQGYVEPGFSAVDDQDGIVNVTVTGGVDTNKAGEYTITYAAIDAAGNEAVTQRMIVVTDTQTNLGDDSEPTGNNLKSSGGGSMGYLLFGLISLLGLRRLPVKLKYNNLSLK